MNRAFALPTTESYDSRLYARFRLLFGIYLLWHFAALVPWATETFSSGGVLPEAKASPLVRLFPNVLAVFDPPWFVTVLVGAAAVSAIPFALGIADRAFGLFMFYALACLYGRNPLIANPSLPYVGWLLLAHATLPPLGMGAGLFRSAPPGWRFSPELQGAAWLLLAAGYSYSGYTKLVSPSWLDGTALTRVLESPLARPGFVRETLLSLPSPLLSAMSYGALALELFFLPLALIAPLRPYLWAALLGMHLSLIGLIDFADLSFGMVLFHLFVLDPDWWRRRTTAISRASTRVSRSPATR